MHIFGLEPCQHLQGCRGPAPNPIRRYHSWQVLDCLRDQHGREEGPSCVLFNPLPCLILDISMHGLEADRPPHFVLDYVLDFLFVCSLVVFCWEGEETSSFDSGRESSPADLEGDVRKLTGQFRKQRV